MKVVGFGVVLSWGWLSLASVRRVSLSLRVTGCGCWKAAADALATKVGAFTCLKSLLYARYVCAAGNTPHNVDVA